MPAVTLTCCWKVSDATDKRGSMEIHELESIAMATKSRVYYCANENGSAQPTYCGVSDESTRSLRLAQESEDVGADFSLGVDDFAAEFFLASDCIEAKLSLGCHAPSAGALLPSPLPASDEDNQFSAVSIPPPHQFADEAESNWLAWSPKTDHNVAMTTYFNADARNKESVQERLVATSLLTECVPTEPFSCSGDVTGYWSDTNSYPTFYNASTTELSATSGDGNAIIGNTYLFNNYVANNLRDSSSAGAQNGVYSSDMNYESSFVNSISEPHSTSQPQYQCDDVSSVPTSNPLDVSTSSPINRTILSSHYSTAHNAHSTVREQACDSLFPDVPPPPDITSTMSEWTTEQILYGAPVQFNSPVVPSEFASPPPYSFNGDDGEFPSVVPSRFTTASPCNVNCDDGKVSSVFPDVSVVGQIEHHHMTSFQPSDFRNSIGRYRLASDGDSEPMRTPTSTSPFQTRAFVRNCVAVLPTTRQSNVFGDGTQSRSEPPTPATLRRRPINPPPPPPNRSTCESHNHLTYHPMTMTLPRNHRNNSVTSQRQTTSSALDDKLGQSVQDHSNGSASSSDAGVMWLSTASPQVKDIRAALLDKISLCQPPRTSVAIVTGRSPRSSSKDSFAGVKRSGLTSSSMLSSLSVSSLPAAVLCTDVEPRRSFANVPPPEPPRRGSSSVSPSTEPKFHRHYDRFAQRIPDNVRSNLLTFSSFHGSTSSTTDLTDLSAENRSATNDSDFRMAASAAVPESNGDDTVTGNRIKSVHCRSVVDLTSNDDNELSSWIRKQTRNSRRDLGLSSVGNKPVAQIRPSAIRAPTAASTYVGTKYGCLKSPYDRTQCASGESEADVVCGNSRNKQVQGSPCDSSTDNSTSPVIVDDFESPPSTDSSVNLVSTGRRVSTCSNTSGSIQGGTLSRFGSIRSRIKDYLSAAATGVSTNRKQVLPTSSSSISIGSRQRRVDRKTSSEFGDGRLRENSPATRWRPDTDDYAPVGRRDVEPETTGTGSEDRVSSTTEQYSEVSVSCMDRWTTFAGPRPYSTPRRIATHVSVPSGLSERTTANSPPSQQSPSQQQPSQQPPPPATPFGDVTTSITSRLSTFLTFLGRNPSVTAELASSSSSGAFHQLPNSDVDNYSDFKQPRAETEISNTANVADMRKNMTNKSETVSQSALYRSPSFNKPEVVPSDLDNGGLYTATLGRSRSISGVAKKRQPIRFVRESHQVLSTFSSATTVHDESTGTGNKPISPPVDLATDSKYHVLPDGEQLPTAADKHRLERLTSDDSSKYNTVGSRSFIVSKHTKQRSAPSTPREVQLSSVDDVISGTNWKNQVSGNADKTPMTSSFDVNRKSEAKEAVDSNVRSTNQRVFVGHVTFGKFDSDVDRLVRSLNEAASRDGNLSTSASISQNCASPVSRRRDQLLVLTRRFVADSQRMVSSAVGPSAEDLLANSVQDSLSTLAEIVNAAIGAAGDIHQGGHHQGQQLPSPKAIILLGRVRDLVETYRSTVWTARTAAGLSFDSAEMKTLVTQATSLAAMLGSLIRMLSRVD